MATITLDNTNGKGQLLGKTSSTTKGVTPGNKSNFTISSGDRLIIWAEYVDGYVVDSIVSVDPNNNKSTWKFYLDSADGFYKTNGVTWGNSNETFYAVWNEVITGLVIEQPVYCNKLYIKQSDGSYKKLE